MGRRPAGRLPVRPFSLPRTKRYRPPTVLTTCGLVGPLQSDFTLSRKGAAAPFWRMVGRRGPIHLSRRGFQRPFVRTPASAGQHQRRRSTSRPPSVRGRQAHQFSHLCPRSFSAVAPSVRFEVPLFNLFRGLSPDGAGGGLRSGSQGLAQDLRKLLNGVRLVQQGESRGARQPPARGCSHWSAPLGWSAIGPEPTSPTPRPRGRA
jgi:hypothetical protein